MTNPHLLQVESVGDVAAVRIVDRRLMDDVETAALGRELYRLVDQDRYRNILLNFQDVNFVSSAALGKLITLDKKVRAQGGRLVLTNIKPQIRQTAFELTLLTRVFDIRDTEQEAWQAFAQA